jgi:hypothetical protein
VEIADLIDRAARGEFATVHVIAGEERFFVDRATAALRRAVVGEEGDAFNEEVFQGRNGSAQRILEAARTLPMMAQRRFVLVRGVDQLSDADQERLADYLESPADTTCMVLTAEKLDGRGRLARNAKKLGVLSSASSSCAPMRPRPWPMRWARTWPPSTTRSSGWRCTRALASPSTWPRWRPACRARGWSRSGRWSTPLDCATGAPRSAPQPPSWTQAKCRCASWR